jgi:hypothetical protein
MFCFNLQRRSLRTLACLPFLNRWLGPLLWLSLLICLLFWQPEPAFAAIHRYDENVNQVMFRSQQSLRDSSDQAWQAVLYKRLNAGQVETFHLRLIGFPGVVEVNRAQPLQISTDAGKTWTAQMVSAAELPLNVGEFDVKQVMAELNTDAPLRLAVPLQSGQIVKLVAPPFVVREWRSVFEQFAIE